MRPSFRLVPDFIVPHLDRSTYGCHLQWEDKKNGIFKISRIHQSSEMWNEECIQVYKAWSIKKKLWKVDDPKKTTKAKHRLITALRRNPEIEMLHKESTFYRFRLVRQHSSGERRDPKKESEPLNVTEMLFEPEMFPSDGCCCQVLLDNYLCNQKCIWHGDH